MLFLYLYYFTYVTAYSILSQPCLAFQAHDEDYFVRNIGQMNL